MSTLTLDDPVKVNGVKLGKVEGHLPERDTACS